MDSALRIEAVISVRDSQPLPLMAEVERRYVDHFGADPEDKGGWYQPDVWKRISRVFERLDKGGHVLDVGTGAGQFVNALALSGEFRSVTTIDPTRFNKYIELSDQIVRHDMSIAAMEFGDDSFDVVTCMEVLEHLPEDVFAAAIEELRRVCRGQLVITVPYREPPPLAATHVRRFEDSDFIELFPRAQFWLLHRPPKPWILIEERPNTTSSPRIEELTEEISELRSHVASLESIIAKLKGRKVIRLANWAGRTVRSMTAKSTGGAGPSG